MLDSSQLQLEVTQSWCWPTLGHRVAFPQRTPRSSLCFRWVECNGTILKVGILWKLQINKSPARSQIYLISRQQNRDQMPLYQPFPWGWMCPGFQKWPPWTLEDLATKTSRGNISSRWLCLAPVLAAASLLSFSSSYASAASGQWILRNQWQLFHSSSCFSRICGMCGGSGSTDFAASSTNVSMRQSGVMAEGAAFRSFKDTVISSLNVINQTLFLRPQDFFFAE